MTKEEKKAFEIALGALALFTWQNLSRKEVKEHAKLAIQAMSVHINLKTGIEPAKEEK